ncbi:DUF5994 family protein [Saccharothrix sp. MB29]|nr:DUF5994 family protein [Saccharothrix sp. MB29]
MISDRLGTTPGDRAEHRPRLAMKPDAARGGLLDGAWWPRSTDPAAEFPALVAALGGGGPIRRVSYHLGTWERAERGLDVGGAVVRTEGFHTTQPDTVTLIRADYTRVRLLVVPPGTTDDVAHAVLRATATSGPTATVEEIMAGNGLVAGQNPVYRTEVPRTPKFDAGPDERWDAEGGAARRRAVLGTG